MSESTTTAPPIPYRIVLPPGWVRIPIDKHTDETVRDVAHRLAEKVDAPARGKAETFLREQLATAVRDAAANRGQDLYFPTLPIEGVPVPMSVVISEVALPTGATNNSPTDALLSFAARSAGSVAAEIDGVLAVRASVDISASDKVPATRRVSYLVNTPTAPPRLMLVTSSIVRLERDGENELLEAYEFLFDTIATTIRFQRDGTDE
jgi:hypothetical protein